MTVKKVFIGFDPREADAYAVAEASIKAHTSGQVQIHPIDLKYLRMEYPQAPYLKPMYWRPTSRVDGQLWDDISGAPMSTEFAISRFLVPHLAEYKGWALFMDCDMLIRSDLHNLFALADNKYAVMCVKHDYEPTEAVKMDGQAQSRYARKNWSSVMLFNCEHPSNKALHPQYVNAQPGRDLHRFAWLPDDQIGELEASWNWLVGHSSQEIEPDIVHFTTGIPSMPGYENVPYADEWRDVLARIRVEAA